MTQGAINNLIVNVGTTNNSKIEAVRCALERYDIFKNCYINPIQASSGVSDQPKTLLETVTGAQNRARNSFKECNYSIGIESGLVAVPESNIGYMDMTVCAIYDGTNFYMGISPGFEYPQAMITEVFENGLEISQAATLHKFSDNPKLGAAEGMVGILTKGRMTRSIYTQSAIIMALIQIENKEKYTSLGTKYKDPKI